MMMRFLRATFAIVTGYAIMVVLITLVQETLFGGVSWNGSTLPVLAAAGALTFLSAVIGGFVATALSGMESRMPALVMCAAVAVETTGLLITGRIGEPLWFDLSASASLVVGLLLGAQGWLSRGILPGRSHAG